jgi:hypothetical protein
MHRHINKPHTWLLEQWVSRAPPGSQAGNSGLQVPYLSMASVGFSPGLWATFPSLHLRLQLNCPGLGCDLRRWHCCVVIPEGWMPLITWPSSEQLSYCEVACNTQKHRHSGLGKFSWRFVGPCRGHDLQLDLYSWLWPRNRRAGIRTLSGARCRAKLHFPKSFWHHTQHFNVLISNPILLLHKWVFLGTEVGLCASWDTCLPFLWQGSPPPPTPISRQSL